MCIYYHIAVAIKPLALFESVCSCGCIPVPGAGGVVSTDVVDTGIVDPAGTGAVVDEPGGGGLGAAVVGAVEYVAGLALQVNLA